MIDLKKIFNELGKYSVKAIRTNLESNNRVATGKTNAAIRFEADNNGFIVYAPNHITALQDGRKPSSGGGGKGFFDDIVEWCRARGIDEKAAYPIYRKINREGYQGTPNVLNNPLDEIIKNTKFTLAKGVKSEILNTFKATK